MNTEENDTEAELAAWELLREARLELTAVTEQRDRLLEEREQWRLSSVCRELTEQRDRLAEVLRNIMAYRKGEKPYDYWRLPFEERENAAFDVWMQIENSINQALQSLTTNNER